MSKKKIKNKTTGFDIVYRVVCALLVIAMFPALWFGPLLYYEIDHTAVSGLLDLINGTENSPGITYGAISLSKYDEYKDIINLIGGDGGFDWKAIISNPVWRPVIVAAVLLLAALIVGLVILGFALFSNKTVVITALSGTGFLLTLASYIAFTPFFADKFASGKLTLAGLLNVNGIVNNLIFGFVGDVKLLQLSSAFTAVLFLMLAILIWSASVIIVNASEKKK